MTGQRRSKMTIMTEVQNKTMAGMTKLREGGTVTNGGRKRWYLFVKVEFTPLSQAQHRELCVER